MFSGIEPGGGGAIGRGGIGGGGGTVPEDGIGECGMGEPGVIGRTGGCGGAPKGLREGWPGAICERETGCGARGRGGGIGGRCEPGPLGGVGGSVSGMSLSVATLGAVPQVDKR